VGGASDELIELYNATPSPVTLDGNWKLEGRSAGGASYTTRWIGAGGTIPPYGHYLIVGSSYTQLPAGDDMLSSSITDAGSVRLLNGTAVVDAICYYFDATTQLAFTGDYSCEGSPVSNQPHDNSSTATSNVDVSLERKPGGTGGNCTDTDDNTADFDIASPAYPENTQSPATP